MNSITNAASNLCRISLAVHFTFFLFVGTLLFSPPIYAADFQTPPPWEAKPRNPKLLDAQVQALMEKDSAPLNQFSTESGVDKEFIQVTNELTAAAVQVLQKHKEATFDGDAAPVFAIWMQAAANTLVEKRDTGPERIKAAKVEVFGFVFWMITDVNLSPLPTVKITLDFIKRAYEAFCPHYPFC